MEDVLSNLAGDIGNSPDMFHPDYGWIRVNGILTEAGKRYFKDQRDKTDFYTKAGNC